MLRNYLTIALRTLLRNKGYTVLNVAGLAVGLAAALLILLYVQDERSYDRHHTDADRVFRLTEEVLDERGAANVHRVLVDPPLALLLKSTFPEVTHAARLTPVGPLLSHGDRHVDSGECYWADPDLFEILSFRFAAGDPGTALAEPFSLVLSRSKARALFGEAEALGQTVVVNNEHAFTVTGVFEDLPASTHLPVDVLGSLSTMERWFGRELTYWDSPNYATYVRLAEGASAARLARKLPALLEAHREAEAARRSRLHLQAVTDIHLHSHLVGELAPNGDVRYVYLFSAVAVLILLIAAINFTNLATARASRRAKEVGVRKVVGARRSALVGQFLGESVLLAFVSLALAVGLVAAVLPAFNDFTGKALALGGEGLATRLALFAAIGLGVGVAAGSYPAFYLSAFRPAVVLKGRLHRRRSRLRATLVVVQFAIAIVLLVGTAVIYRQLAFVREQNLGFDQEHVLILPTVWDLREDFEPFRERLLQHPDVLQAAQSNPVPSSRLSGTAEAQAQHADGRVVAASLFNVWADAHFFPTYAIPFVAGRPAEGEADDPEDAAFVLNETAARSLGWDDPADAVDRPLTFGGWRGRVAGVVRDFHMESLHQAIAPMVFYREPRNYRLVSVRLRAGSDLEGVLDFLEGRWQAYEPNAPLTYRFLDERFQAAYEAERRLGRTVAYFAGLAVLITALGLFGMATFTVEQRTKEIGVRKVLGASAAGIVLLLSREFGALVGIAFVVAAPVAYLGMDRWLGGFAYHAALSWWLFAAAGLGALAVALLTVGWQALRAARTDPARVLRYE